MVPLRAVVTSVVLLWTLCHANVTRDLHFDTVENIPEGTLVGTITGPSPPFLIVGTDTSDLTIDQSNGQIRTKVKLDRESRDLYSFVAIPLNGGGESVRVSVRVTDTNDNSPTFATSVMTVEFPENTPRDVKRTLQPARDRDLGLFNTQRYVISDGNVNNAFRLSSHRERDGVLYLDLTVNGFLDRETTPFYNLVIDAFDGGVPPLKGSMTVHVTLSDVNDNSPIFNQSRYFATISENVTTGTAVLQVFATDTDGGVNGKVTYAINRRQTDKDSFFVVDQSTGVISVNRQLDFETKEIHELVVVARDGGLQPLETTVFVSIRVLDVSDHQPMIGLVFLTNHGGASVSEGANPGEFVARVTVSDPDEKQDYSTAQVKLVSGGRGHFQLEKRNGAVYLMVAPRAVIDREKFPEYGLTLTATDPSLPTLNTSITVRIGVTDLNDNRPLFSDSEFYGSVDEVADIGTSVLQIIATDADEGQNAQVKYSIVPVPGSHSDWFSIDPESGLIVTRAQVDCETEAMPRMTVVATDNGAPPLSSSATVFIQIKNVNDNEPVFDQSFYNVSVLEDAPVGKCILKVSATDPDCGINAVVSYRIREGNSKFRQIPWTINPSTGEICSFAPLDYEDRNLYELSVVASDAGGLSATAVVRIQLLDVNDNDPVFYPSFYETTILEDSEVGTYVVTVKAKDADTLESNITYAIEGGNESGLFEIHPNLGTVTLNRRLTNVKSSKKQWELSISASDGGSRTGDTKVLVNIAAPTSSGPRFSQGRYLFRISEDAPIYSVLGSVSASSLGSSKVVYSISSGDEDGLFQIDSSSGQIKNSKLLDREKISTVLLLVTAQEQNLRSISHAQVEIQIRDVNDHSPEFESSVLSIWVAESAEVGSVIYVVRATDEDEGNFGKVGYRILEDRSALFRIDSETGDLRLVKALDFENVKKHELVIGAFDFGNPPKSSNCTISVEVQDVNDCSPKFEENTYHVTVSESLAPNSNLIEVRAEDADVGNNGRITYSLSRDGQTEGPFDIFPATGVLYLRGALDRETQAKYPVVIVATDHGLPPLSATTTVMVTVEDENDNDPIFEKATYTFSVDENNLVGSYVGQVRATDLDTGDNGALRYSIQESAYDSAFEIDSISGIIRTTQRLDRERVAVYEVQVAVHDLGHPQQRQTEVIALVKVNDLNDCAPRVVEPQEERLIVREEQPEGTQVATIVATDADLGKNGSLVYSLLNDEDFTIDPVSGVIRTRKQFRFDLRSSYSVTVAVRDRGSPRLETSQNYRIEVIELDDAFHQTQTGSKLTFEVVETVPVGHLVGSLRRDDENESRMTFDLIRANTTDGTFELDKRNGKIYLARNLDYEVTSEYNFQVRFTEPSGTFGLRQVAILVKDENDEKPTFPNDPVEIRVSEDVLVGSGIFNLSAVDLDGGPNGIVHYAISFQKPSSKFRINTLTGRIHVQEALDFEKETSYVLGVTATDQALDAARRLSTSVTLHILVDDVNDNAPRFLTPPKISVGSGESAGSTIHTVIAVDSDSGVNGEVTYGVDASSNQPHLFNLDSQTGHLKITKNFPSEKLSYILNITATDGGFPPKISFQNLHITVEAMDTNPPKFEKQKYTAKVQENAMKGTPVTKVSTISNDNRPNNTVLYVLPEAQSENYFGIQPMSGSLSVTSQLDREVRSEVNLTVYAFDAAMETMFDKTSVTVKIVDTNDNRPKFLCPSLRVPENQELGVIHTFAASDPDVGRGGEVTFAITGGNHDNTFSIDLHSGQLKCRPLDRERRSSYVLVITAQDQGLPAQRASCNVTVTVTPDENDNSPDFVQKEYKATVREDAAVGTTVLSVEATDADLGNNAAILYSLSNVSSPHFRIDEKTGAIMVAGILDREAIREYLFEVVATDGGIYDSRSSKTRIFLSVTDVNDNRPQFVTPLVTTVEVSADAKPGTRIAQVRATDRDSGVNGHVTYALEGHMTKVKVHPDSGVVSIAESLEREAGTVLTLKVIAKDQGVPSLMTTSVIQILVGQVPVASTLRFTETTYKGSIPENSAPGTPVVQVTALRNDGRRQRMIYEIIGGNDDFGFEIEKNEGQIRVKNSSALDREKRENLTLVISASTDSATAPLTAFTVVVISLVDENDSSPEFNQDLYTVAVWEGNSKGAFVIQVSAQDADEGPNAQLMYYIIDGNEDNAFVIEPPHSGIVKTNIVLDREIQEEYRLTIVATDDGTPQSSGSCVLKVKVIDLNDNVPTFPPVSDLSVSESAPIGTLVTTLVANDVDAHPDLVYTFESNPGAFFSLGKYDGRIWLMKELDYETKKSHVLKVRVSDSVHQSETDVKVNVIDANDNPPRFLKDVYEAVVSDRTEPGTEILQVFATDVDTQESSGQKIKYSLAVSNSAKSRGIGSKLRIDELTGKIYANDSFSNTNVHGYVELSVVARDSGTPSLSSKVTLWVQIQAAANGLIKFSSNKYSAEIHRNSSVGTVLLKLDVNSNRQRRGNLHFHYEISAGNSKNLFAIGSHTGEIFLLKTLSTAAVEIPRDLTVTLTCTRSFKCSDIATVQINVIAADTSPLFKQTAHSVTVSEKKPIGSNVFKFEPIRSPDPVSYTITSGGKNGKPFDLNRATGAVTLREALDFAKVKGHRLVILAESGATKTLITLDIVVEDTNNHAPQFLLPSYLEFVPENEPIGTPVFIAKVIDPDGQIFGNVTYSILENSAKQKFQIGESTGLVTTSTTFDYETLNRFHFTVRAIDGGGLATTVKVQIDVTSKDEYAPIFRQKVYRWTVPSNAESGFVVGTVRATDEDQGVDGLVFYTISTQNGHFRINRTTGTVSLREPLRSDLNTSLVIVASSGQLESKSTSVGIQINVGPPSVHFGSANHVSGIPEWLIGVLASAVLLFLVIAALVLILFLRKQNRRKRENSNRKPEMNFPGSVGNFDTMAYTTHSTMLAGASSQPNSLYSPQYSDLAELSRRRHPASDLSEKSQNSASSGRGSAEEEEDEEIRMINEGRLTEQKIRESLGMLPDSGMHEDDADSVQNTKEYLARLGIRPNHAQNGTDPEAHVCATEIPFDLSLIYSQIGDEDEGDHGQGHAGSIQGQRSSQGHTGSTKGQEVKSDPHRYGEGLSGYNLDHLKHWGPQYQPLAHVFSEIARLNEDVASGHYSNVLGDLGLATTGMSPNGRSTVGRSPIGLTLEGRSPIGQQSSSCNNSTSGKSDKSSFSGKGGGGSSLAGSKKAIRHKNKVVGPGCADPMRRTVQTTSILPRSPITTDLTFSSPLSPSFSPELSFCNTLPVLPEHNVGIRTAAYPHSSYASSESSEARN